MFIYNIEKLFDVFIASNNNDNNNSVQKQRKYKRKIVMDLPLPVAVSHLVSFPLVAFCENLHSVHGDALFLSS